MNGAPLPMLNGFPIRLIVPGWFATYWVKALSQVTIRTKPLDNFWVNTAYRVPATPYYSEAPQHPGRAYNSPDNISNTIAVCYSRWIDEAAPR
jgi:DMSO/TMAO reductase YedYZ molybdopterin-dependent catalytic subunit